MSELKCTNDILFCLIIFHNTVTLEQTFFALDILVKCEIGVKTLPEKMWLWYGIVRGRVSFSGCRFYHVVLLQHLIVA